MPDIFISYSRADRPLVRVLAETLIERGLDVWWDPEIKTGSGFRMEIQEKLSGAKAVIVIWSQHSVASRFVCDEADEGAAKEILYPALVDLVDIPLGFRQIQTADLTHWRGNRKSAAFKEFVDVIVDAVGGPKKAAPPAPRPEPQPQPTPAPAPPPAPKPKEPMKPKSETKRPARASNIKMRHTVTGSNIRVGLFVRAFLLTMIVTAGFAALAYGSDFIFSEFRPYFVAAVAVLTFFSRYLTFLADKATGAASLKLLSNTYLTLAFVSAIAVAPILIEGRIYAAALEAVRIKGIEGADINGVAFSDDGSLFATASDDGEARLWDAHTGVGLGVFHEHEDWVWSADFSPEGDEVVTASRDMTARVWSTKNRKQRLVLEGHRSSVYDAAFSPNGDIIATSSSDDTIILWNVEDGAAIATLTGHQNDVNALAFSPDGRRIASASSDGTVRLWNVGQRSLQAVVESGGPQWNDVVFSASGDVIAAAGNNGAVRAWRVSSRQRVFNQSVPGRAFGVAFVESDTRLAVGALDNVVRIFDLSSGALVRELTGNAEAARDIAAGAGGALVASGSRDNSARIWSAASGEEVQVMGHVQSALQLPIAIDAPPVLMASRAATPMNLSENREKALFLLTKGLGVGFGLLVIGLLLKGILFLVRVPAVGRVAVPLVTGAGAAYVAALILSALPIEAFFLWITAIFAPSAGLAFLRWLLAISVLRARR